MGKRKEGYILITIFLVAFIIRLGYLLFIFGLENVPDADSYQYNEYATNLIIKNVYVDNNNNYSFRSPGYPFFLALVYSIFGHSYPVVKIIQLILSALTCIIIYSIAREMCNEKVAMFSGFFSCIYYGLFEMPSHILSETLFTFLLCISILFFLKIGKKKNYKIYASVFLALATLTRPITLIFPFFVFVWLLLKYKLDIAIKNFITIIFVFGITILPWTIRNYSVHHKFVPVNIQSGFDFWASNNSESKGQWNPSNLNYEKYKNFSEFERDKQYFREGLKFLKSQSPLQNIKLLSLKIGSFLYPFLPGYDLTYGFILPFWLIGMVLIVKKENYQYIFLFFVVLLFFIITIIFYGSPRFRSPMSPFVIIFGAVGINYVYQKIKSLMHRILFFSFWLLVNCLIFRFFEPIRLILRTIRS